MKLQKNRENIKKLGLILLAVAFIVPAISMASKTKEIFVDDSANGNQDGSYNHPYKTIEKAIKNANGKTKIIVDKGIYKENIIVPEDVKITGKDKKKVIIKADSNSKPAIVLESKTELTNISVEGGKSGILIKETGKGEITITDCLIRKSDGDGIKIENGDKSSDRKVNIINNKIYENNKSGIYSESRRLVIIDNQIFDNGLDGIDMEKSTKAYIEKNEINNSDGVAIKLRLDKSDIVITKNSFYKNDKDGVEVRYEGKAGWVNIKKNSFVKNDRFAIVRIYKDTAPNANFSGLVIENNNNFSQNGKGNVADPLKN